MRSIYFTLGLSVAPILTVAAPEDQNGVGRTRIQEVPLLPPSRFPHAHKRCGKHNTKTEKRVPEEEEVETAAYDDLAEGGGPINCLGDNVGINPRHCQTTDSEQEARYMYVVDEGFVIKVYREAYCGAASDFKSLRPGILHAGDNVEGWIRSPIPFRSWRNVPA
ncbi:MAG: hypothetical protein M1821_000263 [Bathelium mastoideum]|nr:MAG: hypothetical protein M1821_000263 [Bathelium mastoideum]